jgi:BetI-type transcriptional repressor, C-terminal
VLQDEVGADIPPLERFEALWTPVIDSLAAYRPLWAAQFEILAQVDSASEVRAFLADAMERGRLGLAELFQHLDPVADADSARAVGGPYHAILSGILVQWLTDPDRAPTARELAKGMRLILGELTTAGTSSTAGSPQDT